jgi:signal peptidase I
MEPTIHDGQIVVAEGLSYLWRPPKVGEIVLCSWQSKKLVKRIVGLRQGNYLLRGDNREDSLEIGLVGKEMILAKVVFV